MEVFSLDALQHFAKDGRIPVASFEEPKKTWKAEVFFIVEKGTAVGMLVDYPSDFLAAELSLLTSNDDKPYVKRLDWKIEGSSIERTNVTWVQHPQMASYDPSMYKLPEDTVTGDGIPAGGV